MKHKWLSIVKNIKEEKTVDVTIRGEIVSEKWFDGEFSPADLDDIMNIDADFMNVFLNTIGGDVFAGIEIYSMLKRHPAEVTVINEGVAASIGTTIMAAGDQRGMVKNGMYYLHNPLFMYAGGYASDLRKMANDLDITKEAILTAYDYNKKLSKDQISNLMDEETLMTAQEALDNRFIDYIVDSEVEIAKNESDIVINGVKIDKKRYKNLKTDKIEVKTVKIVENKDKEHIDTEYNNFAQIIAENQLNTNNMEVLNELA